MSNLDDFFGGAVQVGDYISTERTLNLVPADGRDVFGFGYAKLESVMPISDAIEEFDYVDNLAVFRTMCVQAHGRLGWIGYDATGQIDEIDFHASTQTDTGFSTAVSLDTYFDSCCSDIGTRIFMLGGAVAGNDLYCVVSEDTGATWNEFVIFAAGFTGMITAGANVNKQLASIQCDVTGDNLRVVFTNSTTNQTVVYESTDVGQTWAEILTPRETLSNAAATGQHAVSRDLSTVIIASDTEMYISVGGALTDVASNFPGTLSVDLKMSVSDDGSTIVVWDTGTATKVSNKIIFYTTTDDGVSWLTNNLELNIPPSKANSVILTSIYFDPDDNNVLYAMCSITFTGATDENISHGDLYKINISTFEVDKIGELSGSNNALSSLYSHLGSDFKSHNAGFTYGINDGQTVTRAYSVDIATGMILRNVDPSERLKIFAGRQSAGPGTLGYSWDRLTSPIATDLRNAYISLNKAIIVASGAAGKVINSVDSGATFAEQTSGFNSSFSVREIDGSDDSSVIIASATGQVRRSVNDGVTWAAATGLSNTGSSTDDQTYVCSCIANGATVIVGARSGELDISTNSGVSFSLLATPFSGSSNTKLRAGVIARDDDQIMFVGNEDGEIKISTNGGSSFVNPSTPPVPSIDEAKVFAIDCSEDGSIVIACMSDRLFLSTDTGDTWAEVAVGFSKVSYRRLSISNDGTIIFAVNNNGLLIRSLDSGVNFYKTVVPWEETRRKADAQLATDGTLAYAVTDNGFIYRTA